MKLNISSELILYSCSKTNSQINIDRTIEAFFKMTSILECVMEGLCHCLYWCCVEVCCSERRSVDQRSNQNSAYRPEDHSAFNDNAEPSRMHNDTCDGIVIKIP